MKECLLFCLLLNTALIDDTLIREPPWKVTLSVRFPGDLSFDSKISDHWQFHDKGHLDYLN